MYNLQKKRNMQKLWGWICLSINFLIVSLHLTNQDKKLLYGGILLSVLTICYGTIKTQMDKLKGDTAYVTIVIEYVCVYIITFLLGIKIASYILSVSVLIALVIASLTEILILVLIIYWQTIRHKFPLLRQNAQKKSRNAK